jgi:hypothetical protein
MRLSSIFIFFTSSFIFFGGRLPFFVCWGSLQCIFEVRFHFLQIIPFHHHLFWLHWMIKQKDRVCRIFSFCWKLINLKVTVQGLAAANSQTVVSPADIVLSTTRVRTNTTKVKQQGKKGSSSRHLATQYDKLRTHSILASVGTRNHSARVYSGEGEVRPRMW